MMVAFYVIPFPPKRPINAVPYSWEPWQSAPMMQQLYVGEYLTWTEYCVQDIFGYILISDHTVRYGACSYFLSVRHEDEWLLAGLVRIWTGEAHYFIMYQTIHDGYDCVISEVTLMVGEYVWVNINHLGGNKWRGNIPKIRFNVTVQFEMYPNEFCALGKSLDSCNELRSTFSGLIWWSSEGGFNYWGNSFFGTPSEVEIREDYPYHLIIHNEYYSFSIIRQEVVRKRGRGNFFADLYIL